MTYSHQSGYSILPPAFEVLLLPVFHKWGNWSLRRLWKAEQIKVPSLTVISAETEVAHRLLNRSAFGIWKSPRTKWKMKETSLCGKCLGFHRKWANRSNTQKAIMISNCFPVPGPHTLQPLGPSRWWQYCYCCCYCWSQYCYHCDWTSGCPQMIPFPLKPS